MVIIPQLMLYLKKNNVIDEKSLREIGFTGFEHLVKSERDNKDRLVWNGSLEGVDILIMLVYNNYLWELEKIKIYDEVQSYNLKRYFSTDPTIDEIVEAIKSKGSLGGICP